MPERLRDPAVSELLFLCIDAFIQAVGEEQDAVAGFELQLICGKLRILKDAHDEVRFFTELPCLSLPAQEGLLMAGAQVGEPAAHRVEHTEESGDEDVFHVARAQIVVHFMGKIAQVFGGRDACLDHFLRPHHEESCGDALAGNVGKAEEQAPVVQHEIVVKVAADFPGRLQEAFQHCRAGLEAALRQRLRLDAGSQRQLRLHFLFSGGLLSQAFHIAEDRFLHEVELLRQVADLVF